MSCSLCLSLFLSLSSVFLLSLMRPSPQWWWDRQRVIKVVSHLVGKLTSIRTILPRGHPPSLFPTIYPFYSVFPWLSSTILYSSWPDHASALHRSSSLSCVLLSFFIFPYPLLVITLNLSSSAVLFCDGNLFFSGTLKFAVISCMQKASHLQKSMLFKKWKCSGFLEIWKNQMLWNANTHTHTHKDERNPSMSFLNVNQAMRVVMATFTRKLSKKNTSLFLALQLLPCMTAIFCYIHLLVLRM